MNIEKLLFKTHKSLVKTFVRSMLNYDLLMEAPLPAGPKILAVNHPTTTDPFLLPLLVSEPIHILVTEMAFEVPILGALMRKAGHISVPRAKSRIREERKSRKKVNVIQAAVDRLSAGDTIGIFPEGAISPAVGKFCKPHSGAARIALQSGAPVIPVGIHLNPGCYVEKTFTTDSFSDTARWARSGSYYLTVGKALHFAGDAKNRDYVHQVTRQIMDAIEFQSRKSEMRMATTHISWQPLFRRFVGQGSV